MLLHGDEFTEEDIRYIDKLLADTTRCITVLYNFKQHLGGFENKDLKVLKLEVRSLLIIH